MRPVRRPLTEDERAVLREALRDAERRQRVVTRAAVLAGGGIVALLWLLTLLASDAPWGWVTAFWVVVGAGIILWVRRDLAREVAGVDAAPRSALRRGEAEEYRVDASAIAAFEEVEDEGAAWAFQVAPDRLLFLFGQEFYATETFPALRFSLVYPLTEWDAAADIWIVSDGPRATPDRVIAGAWKFDVDDLPGTLQVRPGTIADLERALGAREAG